LLSNEPLYQVDVEQRLDLLNAQLQAEVDRFALLTVERAEAESEYKHRYHRAILRSSEGTVAQKEATAFVRSGTAYREWKLAEALEKATQQKLIALRTQIESARTISANVRASGG
jgi:hypothetical protein